MCEGTDVLKDINVFPKDIKTLLIHLIYSSWWLQLLTNYTERKSIIRSKVLKLDDVKNFQSFIWMQIDKTECDPNSFQRIMKFRKHLVNMSCDAYKGAVNLSNIWEFSGSYNLKDSFYHFLFMIQIFHVGLNSSAHKIHCW